MCYGCAVARTLLQETKRVCLLAVVLGACSQVFGDTASDDAPTSRPRVILETDFTFDVDDVGALAVLHALADLGEVDILAVQYNEVQSNGAAAIHVVNAWYGRPDIPIGVFQGELDDPDDEHSRYIDALAEMRPERTNAVPTSALDIYRRVLAVQPDGSTTIVSVGFVNNLYDLLRHERELIAAKVKELVLMGGVRNDRFNFVRHDLVEQTQTVLRDWPTPIVISQEGADIQTGAALRDSPAKNPVREAYRLWWGTPRMKSRSSWDQLAVLYAVRGLGDIFENVAEGSGQLRNGFTWNMQPGWRTYLALRMDKRELEAVIEALMVAPPRSERP